MTHPPDMGRILDPQATGVNDPNEIIQKFHGAFFGGSFLRCHQTWEILEIDGYSWEHHLEMVDFHGFSWIFIDFHGFSRLVYL